MPEAGPRPFAADAAVAVIGVAFELPGCTTWDELTEILRGGAQLLGPMPAARAAITGVTRTDEDRQVAWLPDITGFDHRSFGVSRAEAELIDPRQRRMLSLAVQAIGHAGYSPAELRGRNVATMVAAFGGPYPTLYDLLPGIDRTGGLAFAGSMHAYAAGRIAYYLDLRGPAMVVDTSCSSFLVALHEARWKLARGEAELALVGGSQVFLGDPPRRTATGAGLGVLSGTDRCRPFDAAADGTALGEGTGFVVIKRLADAVRDGDTVHAVIRGSAVNQDAGRRNGLTAPSPLAQADVITAAWRDAGADPAAIGYLEAHGTGTRIGDPIEIEGLAKAIAGWPDQDGSLVISSAKGTFGHLGGMAGFAGLMRILAQFRAGEIFPTAHFRRANPLLGLAGLPVRIAEGCQKWQAGPGPRLAGISGFGLSGTNAHLVIEEGPAGSPVPGGDPRVLVLSARDAAGLRTLTRRLRATVASDTGGFDLAAAADVLALGREHLPFRRAWVASDGPDLLDQLAADLDAPSGRDGGYQEPLPPVLAFGGDIGIEQAELARLAAEYPGFGQVAESAGSQVPARLWSSAQRHVVWLAGLHATLRDFGVSPALVLSHGAGAAAARVISGTADLGAALGSLAGAPAGPPSDERLRLALAGVPDGTTVIDLAPGTALSAALARSGTTLPVAAVRTVPELLCLLHSEGHALDWRTGLGRPPRRRAELPVAPLAEEPCWPAVTPPHAPAPAAATTAELVLDLARSVLREPGLEPADDFFEHGGNSLNGEQLVARINERFGVGFGVLDLFDFADLAELAEAVDGARPGSPPAEAEPGAPLSGQQRAIWSAIELAPASGAYNLPAAFLLDARPDVAELAERLTALARRHEMLRCWLRDGQDGPRQVIDPPGSAAVQLEQSDADLTRATAAAGRQDLIAWLDKLAAEPLSAYGRPPVRYQLVRARFADKCQYVFMLTTHHLFFDGWSWRIIFGELAESQDGSPPPPSRGYLDYVREQETRLAGERGRELTRFWSEYLGGCAPVPLPTDSAPLSSSALSMTGAHLPLPIDPGFAGGLRSLAQAEHVTLNMVLLAGWAAQLWRITGARDLSIGMPVAGRDPADEAVVGNYVNLIVVRLRLRPAEPLRALLAEVRESALTAQAHRDLPADQILRAAGLAGSASLATSVLNFQSGFRPVRSLGGHRAELLDVDAEGAKFPLNLAFLEYGTELQARVKYASALFHPETVRTWLDEYSDLLHRAVECGGTADLFTLTSGAAAAIEPVVPASPAVIQPPGAPGYLAPRTEAERVLCGLWERHLGLDEIGVRDDFFELGGDSILGIRIVQEARRLGYPLRSSHVHEHRTIEELAEVAERGAGAAGAAASPGAVALPGAADGQAPAGLAPLTPPQLAFFARDLRRHDHWNNSLRYPVRAPLTSGQLRRAVDQLARRHAALRTRFVPTPQGPLAQETGGEPPRVTEIDLRGVAPAQAAGHLHDAATGLHQSLDLRSGPVGWFALCRFPAGLPDQLVVIAHHAIIDLYSWDVLTDELSALLRDGDARALPDPGTSYAEWSRRLADCVRDDPGRFDLTYWRGQDWSAGALVVPGRPARRGGPGAAGRHGTEPAGHRPAVRREAGEHRLRAPRRGAGSRARRVARRCPGRYTGPAGRSRPRGSLRRSRPEPDHRLVHHDVPVPPGAACRSRPARAGGRRPAPGAAPRARLRRDPLPGARARAARGDPGAPGGVRLRQGTGLPGGPGRRGTAGRGEPGRGRARPASRRRPRLRGPVPDQPARRPPSRDLPVQRRPHQRGPARPAGAVLPRRPGPRGARRNGIGGTRECGR